jgi:hypothetical protein
MGDGSVGWWRFVLHRVGRVVALDGFSFGCKWLDVFPSVGASGCLWLGFEFNGLIG